MMFRCRERLTFPVEAIGDGQGAVIGALMYVGAGVLMGPVAAAGGTIAAILGAAALGGGAGGLLGTLLGKFFGNRHAQQDRGAA